MEIKSDELTAVLKEQIEKYKDSIEVSDSGIVISTGDGVAEIYGLENVMMGELLEFDSGVNGIAWNLEEQSIGCIIIGDTSRVKEGTKVKCTGRIAEVPVGDMTLGRVIDPLGNPLDGRGPIKSKKFRPLEKIAPSVVERVSVCESLSTGIKAIDSMIPIGRGQRELIIGDRQIGKSALVIDTILNQKNTDVHCIYVAIGQKVSVVANLIDILKENGAMDYTTVVIASADDPPSLLYIAPFAGCAIGEEYLYSGKHALVIYDDLSKHAIAYRQLSLLLRRPPGREAYPGDIFYLHSRLLERASKLSPKLGGGSLTAIPIIETQAGDISAYIPTNVISITDGQIYIEPDLFYNGIRPAINPGLSVSRVGGAAQIKAMKQVAGKLRLDLAQYREMVAFTRFSTELDKSTQAQLRRGERLTEMLKQEQFVPMPVEEQVIIIYVATAGFLDYIDKEKVGVFEKQFITYIKTKQPEILTSIRDTKELKEETSLKLSKNAEEFLKVFNKK